MYSVYTTYTREHIQNIYTEHISNIPTNTVVEKVNELYKIPYLNKKNIYDIGQVG